MVSIWQLIYSILCILILIYFTTNRKRWGHFLRNLWQACVWEQRLPNSNFRLLKITNDFSFLILLVGLIRMLIFVILCLLKLGTLLFHPKSRNNGRLSLIKIMLQLIIDIIPTKMTLVNTFLQCKSIYNWSYNCLGSSRIYYYTGRSRIWKSVVLKFKLNKQTNKQIITLIRLHSCKYTELAHVMSRTCIKLISFY